MLAFQVEEDERDFYFRSTRHERGRLGFQRFRYLQTRFGAEHARVESECVAVPIRVMSQSS
jgi:hypothetical protein